MKLQTKANGKGLSGNYGIEINCGSNAVGKEWDNFLGDWTAEGEIIMTRPTSFKLLCYSDRF